MGNRPSAPSPELTEELERRLPELASRAACAIVQADILLFCTGAGWSADSGLAVYRDVANVEAYHRRQLTYRDICQPGWLETDPGLFYGFWGACYNDYRNVEPHDGYRIVQRWVEQRFRHNGVSNALRTLQRQRASSSAAAEGEAASAGTLTSDPAGPAPRQPPSEQAQVPAAAAVATAGSFFAFTSNVDAHSHHVFQPHEVYECHGNSENWQCGDRQCAQALSQQQDPACTHGRWRAPPAHRFYIDEETRIAPDGEPSVAAAEAVGSGAAHDADAFRHNWPRCVRCGRLARPAILMFSDSSYMADEAAENAFDGWQAAVRRLASEKHLKVSK